MLKKFKDLTEKEILAIAIAAEEEDGRVYGDFADALRESYPATAQMFEGMRQEEVDHRDRLLAMFRQRFGEHIPLIRRENVKGFLRRNPTWLVRPLGVNVARKQAEVMERPWRAPPTHLPANCSTSWPTKSANTRKPREIWRSNI
jgi:rubrerythrin